MFKFAHLGFECFSTSWISFVDEFLDSLNFQFTIAVDVAIAIAVAAFRLPIFGRRSTPQTFNVA